MVRIEEGDGMAKDLMVELEDRPGTLADLGESMGSAGVNIEAIAGFRAGNAGILHVLVEDAEGAKRALENAGARIESERDVLVLDIEDRPGALGELARRIAAAGVNVDLVYVTAGGKLVIGADDLDAARNALG